MEFKHGDKVIVTRRNSTYYQQTGVVCGICLNGVYTVRFENFRGFGTSIKKNISGKSLNYAPNDKTIMNGSGNKMMSGNYSIAVVKFLKNAITAEYAFACFDQIEVGDYVVCDTANGYHVAKVAEIHQKDDWNGDDIQREVVCVIDFEAYHRRQEVRKERDALKKKMDQMVAENQEMIIYQAIAEKNLEMAEMLKAYRNLGGC